MKLNTADIIWKESSPFSLSHNDIYFNPDHGQQESNYVFFRSNKLDKTHSTSLFTTIGETGFGTGLNFLVTTHEWLKIPLKKNLIFISTERYPLKKQDLIKALSSSASKLSLTAELIDKYPTNNKGFHSLQFRDGKIKLLLMLGDAAESFSRLEAKVDAWYLDGFAPSKNPDMWSPELFEQIGRLSKPGTTFATFTAAGIVKRGLRDVGFDVRKQKGFGRKREMLVGTFVESTNTKPIKKPWFELPISAMPEAVTVIGGGLAGCSTARALAERGIKVTLLEKASALASGGSGNPQGALYAKLPVEATTQGELHLSGFLYSVNLLQRTDPTQSFWSQCGVMQLATSDKELTRQNKLIAKQNYPQDLVSLKSAAELSDIAGTTVSFDGLFFPTAGWVSPQTLCAKLAKHSNILVEHHDISELTFDEGAWLLETRSGTKLSASHVIICNAELANQFKQTEHLPLKTIRGQVSITPETNGQHRLNSVVCGDGYISPALKEQYCFGATYDLKGKELNITTEDHDSNLEKLAKALPSLHADLSEQTEKLEGRTAFRCSTPDYMPIVGPAPVQDQFIEQFAQLRKDRKWRFENAKAEHHPNLFINTGHGSKGLITCPISAELLAAMLCDEPLPLPKDVVDAINPSRFIIKNLIKQTI